MNLYKLHIPNPAPKPTRHWGVDKSYKIVQVRSYEFVRISHLVKYVRIGREIALDYPCNSALFENVPKSIIHILVEAREFIHFCWS